MQYSVFGAVNNDCQSQNWSISSYFWNWRHGIKHSLCFFLVSAFPIIGVDLHQEKLNLGKEFGLTHGIVNKNNLNEKISKILGEKGPEVVFGQP